MSISWQKLDELQKALDSAADLREVIDVLKQVPEDETSEEGHVLADSALIAALKILAMNTIHTPIEELIEVYENIPKWFA